MHYDVSKYEMHVRCPVCGSKHLEYSFEEPSLYMWKQMWWHCKECGNLWKDKPKEKDDALQADTTTTMQ